MCLQKFRKEKQFKTLKKKYEEIQRKRYIRLGYVPHGFLIGDDQL
jgi:hypothetical protein